MNRFRNISLVFAMGFALNASALILYGLDNSANLADPGTGVPFDAVAKIVTSGGALVGSAVHIGGGYMLTANHVPTANSSLVSFDGVTPFALDATFNPTQVLAGADLKIFRLASVPGVTAANQISDPSVTAATAVGWGLGRNPAVPVNSSVVTWGSSSTATKRWGENVPIDTQTLTYSHNAVNYNFLSFYTGLGSTGGLGATEAALTRYDSGSPLFQELGGIWRLVGIAITVSTDGSSTFGNEIDPESAWDANFYIPLTPYASIINNLIVPIPELPTWALAGMALGVLGLSRCRFRRSEKC